jgi:uncharacterized protein YndB with AHSA1/START domain
MATWKQQALIDVPVRSVWELIQDPARFPEWSNVAVTGVPTEIKKGSTFELTGRSPMGMKVTTTFKVEELDDMHEIKLRCQTSGYYSRWLLTEARGNTFTEVEMGVERVPGFEGRISGAMHTKRYLRRLTEQALEGLRRTAAG